MKRTTTLISLFALLSVGANAQTRQLSAYPKGSRVLVAYFSASGVTEQAARTVARVVHGDLYAIRPAEAYTPADLDWTNRQSRSSVEMNDPNARPTLADTDVKMNEYDVIYLGFPIWWYTAPRIIESFVDAYNLTGKMIIPFATSGGSTIQRAVEELSKKYPDYKWTEGIMMNNTDEQALRQLLDRRAW